MATSAAGYIEVRAQIMTLVFYSGLGWRVFSVGSGATEPDWIEFPPGMKTDDPRHFSPANETSSPGN